MTVLLDTHAFLWFVLDDPQLSVPARTLIEDATTDVLVSPASYWEIAIKVRLGKLDLRSSYADFMHRGIVGNNFAVLPIEPKHTTLLTTMPFHHRDPFDRLLVAQATLEHIPIVSNDEVLDAYGVQRRW
ncbi:MAG: type II toxin-antitoxin system VapC family toxin [Rhodopirellula sp.]|nr:type II toxin-antitoxin system VapC family toxin [Rhodopirellula sp.]